MTAQLSADLGILRRSRIYFYHHSVGLNVLEGIERLDEGAGGGRVRMASVQEASAIDGPVLAHGWGGENKRPKTKIDFFAGTIRSWPLLQPDLAFMKFCYVDFDPSTDVDELFAYYKRTLDALKRDFPQIRFAHVTVPPTDSPTDMKSSARRLLGLEVWSDAANAKRAEFSRKIKEGFASDPVFDLALVEATAPDGTQSTSSHLGRKYPSLQPRYTSDGGHLNPEGQRVAGTAAIRFLADALGRTPPAQARK